MQIYAFANYKCKFIKIMYPQIIFLMYLLQLYRKSYHNLLILYPSKIGLILCLSYFEMFPRNLCENTLIS